eukprot:1154513-Pelagomonas_calceolata.AAC.2
MVTEHHNIASKILKGVSKGPHGAGLASIDTGSADRLALQNLQIPEHSTNRTLLKYIFPRRFSDKHRLTSSRPDAILVVPMKRVPRTNSRYLLRSTGGRGGNRGHSAPATATPPTSEVRHPSQLLPDQGHVHLVDVKYCEDTRPKNQLEASKQQHRDLCHHLSRASAQVTLHASMLSVGKVIYTPHTLEPLKELGFDTQTAIKLALNTKSAFEKTSSNSHHQDQARDTASNPPDSIDLLLLPFLVKGIHLASAQGDTPCLGPREPFLIQESIANDLRINHNVKACQERNHICVWKPGKSM